MKIFLSLMLMATSVFGSLLQFQGTPTSNVEVKGEPLPTYPDAKLNNSKLSTAALKLSGAGVRVKKIVLLKIKAYWIASYVEKPELFATLSPLEAVEKSSTKALYMTFLRHLSADKIRDSFADAMKGNGVDMNLPVVKDTLSRMNFDVNEGEHLTILAVSKPGKADEVYFETPKGAFTEKGEGFAKFFWSIWFGKPFDSGIEDLQKNLTGHS